MANQRAGLLDTGDQLPYLTFTTPGGKTITAPDCFQGGWGALLIYRGRW
jgi:hypothetical protein